MIVDSSLFVLEKLFAGTRLLENDFHDLGTGDHDASITSKDLFKIAEHSLELSTLDDHLMNLDGALFLLFGGDNGCQLTFLSTLSLYRHFFNHFVSLNSC